MIEPMYTVDDICALFKVKDPRTARKIMREMDHQEKPRLLVSERAVKAYISRNLLPPASEIRKLMKRKGA